MTIYTNAAPREITWRGPSSDSFIAYVGDTLRLRKELIQLAAMGVRAVEDLEL